MTTLFERRITTLFERIAAAKLAEADGDVELAKKRLADDGARKRFDVKLLQQNVTASLPPEQLAKFKEAIEQTAAAFGEASVPLAQHARKMFDAAALKLRSLEHWSNDQLLAQLPKQARENGGERYENLDLFQLLCLTEYCRRQTTARDPVCYEGAMREKLIPELIRRVQAASPMLALTAEMQAAELEALAKFRTAWELYRSGGASLEEVQPLMDFALQASLPEECSVTELQASPGERWPRIIPAAIAKLGMRFEFAGRSFRVDKLRLKSSLDEVSQALCQEEGATDRFWVKVNT